MPITCAVRKCHNNSNKGSMSYHRFPKCEILKNEWIILCGRSTSWNPKAARVCSIHFRDDDLERDYRHELLGVAPKRRLKRKTVPSLNLPNTMSTTVCDREADEKGERKILVDKIYINTRALEMLRKIEVENILENDNANVPREVPQIKQDQRHNDEEKYRYILNDFSKLKQDHTMLKKEHHLYKIQLNSLENQIKYYKSKSVKVENKEKVLREKVYQLLRENQRNLHLQLEKG